MAKITYIAHDGTERTIEARNGMSVMEVAVNNSIPGIDADCGGACACATCHVFVDAPWGAKTGSRTQQEDEMLNFAAELKDSSRLACQITVTDDLDGLEVTMPEGQH